MAGESPHCRATTRPLVVLLGCLTAVCAPTVDRLLLPCQVALPDSPSV